MEDQTSVVCPQTSNKPRKRWRRRLLVALICLMIGAPAVYLFQKLAAEAERDAIVAELDRTDPGWRTANEPSIPQVTLDGNSLGEIVQGAFALVPKDRAVFGEVDIDIPPFRMADAVRLAVKQQLEQVNAALKAVRKLGDGTARPATSSSNDAATHINYLLWVESAVLAADGDLPGAIDSVSVQFQLAQMPGSYDAMTYLRQLAMRNMAIVRLESVLGTGEIGLPLLQNIQRRLNAETKHTQYYDLLRAERATRHEDFARLATGKATVDNLRSYKRNTGETWQDRVIQHLPGSAIAEADIWCLRGYTEAIAASKQPIQQTTKLFADAWNKWSEQNKQAPYLIRRLGGSVSGKYYLNPAHRRELARLYCAMTAVAAERFRLTHGNWPDSIEKLVEAKFLEEVPVDPIDPLDRGNLRYRVTNDGIVVYSVGPLGKYDGTLRDNEHNPTSEEESSLFQPIEFRLWNPDRRGQPARLPSKLESKKERKD